MLESHRNAQGEPRHRVVVSLGDASLPAALWSTEDARENRSWETLRCILQTHCYTTILLPTRGGQTHRLRRAGQPEESHKQIYRALRIKWDQLPRFKTVVPTKNSLDFVVPEKLDR